MTLEWCQTPAHQAAYLASIRRWGEPAARALFQAAAEFETQRGPELHPNPVATELFDQPPVLLVRFRGEGGFVVHGTVLHGRPLLLARNAAGVAAALESAGAQASDFVVRELILELTAGT